MPAFNPEKLFAPAALSICGATSATGGRVLANLHAGGFRGMLHLGEHPADLALICGGDVPAAFAALGRLGVPTAIVFGAAEDLRSLALAHGIRALGPHSFGLAVPGIGLNATLGHLPALPGRLALVSQSSSMCRAVLDWAAPNGVGFSHIIGIGENHDLGFATALDRLARDPGTGAILLDIHRLKDVRAFLSAARAAARLRPVVAIRAGARRLDPDGAAEAAFAAALRRCGVLSVERMEDLLAAAETLTRARTLRGERLAIVANGRGPARLAADAALRAGLTLDGAIVTTTTAGLAEAAAAQHTAGAVLAVHAPSGAEDTAGIAALAAAARGLAAPLLVAALGETTGAAHRRSIAAAGLPVFATPEEAVRGFLHLAEHQRNREAARELPASTVLEVAPDRAAAAALLSGPEGLAADAALAVLAAYGIAAVAPGGPGPQAQALRIAVRRDALFGPVIGFGEGGAAADRAADLALDLPPLNLPLTRALIGRSRIARALGAAQAEAVADVLVRVSQLLVDFPAIGELDINPLFAAADAATAAAATLRLGKEPGRLAIAPYPAELTARFQGRHEAFLIRPIRPEDAAAHAAFFARLPAEDVRFRFFTAVRALPPEQMARLTQVDYDREIAFIAVREPTGETAGVARLVRNTAGEAEFAIVVQPDAKGQGLAAHLMRRLLDWGRAQGVAAVVGQVLADNAAMLGFVRHLGFTLHRQPDDETVLEARLELS